MGWHIQMNSFIISFIVSAITTGFAVLFISHYFYQLGKIHGSEEVEMKIHTRLLMLNEEIKRRDTDGTNKGNWV